MRVSTIPSMIRKQLYITPEQDRALKQQSRALGLSEAELVRRALNEVVTGDGGLGIPPAGSALAELLENTRRLGKTHRLPPAFRFDREALYAEREGSRGPLGGG